MSMCVQVETVNIITVKALFHRHGALFFNPSFILAFY